MKQLFALVTVCTFGIACTDKPASESVPTAPSAAVVPAAAVGPAVSTICLSYSSEESRLKEAVTRTPDNARLKGQLTAIEAAIKDACR